MVLYSSFYLIDYFTLILISSNCDISIFQLTKPNDQIIKILQKMTRNGNEIREFLENYQHEMSLGCIKNGHKYLQNGTISCIKCGKIKTN